MAKLKPCPFCGSTKLKIESKSRKINALVKQDTYSVRCNVCHARGGATGGKVIKSCLYAYRDNMQEWTTTKEELQQKAIEAWNRREDNESR